MKIVKVKNYSEMSKKASEILINEINSKPKIVVGFATGKTPRGLYKNLVKAYREKRVDFSEVLGFGLDEYYPIKKSDKKSFHYFLHKHLFDKVNIKKFFLLNGEAKNPEKECEDYEKKLKKNRIDVLILGVGLNGHIAFNEPGSNVNSRTRVVNLAKETIRQKSGVIRKVPSQALTIGIKNILSARKILLLYSGKKKERAIKPLFKGISKKHPVSYLRKHRNLVVIGT